MFGFVDIGVKSDHAIAAFLRKHDAINTWHHTGNSNQWYDASGKVILVAVYDKDDIFVSRYWILEQLKSELI